MNILVPPLDHKGILCDDDCEADSFDCTFTTGLAETWKDRAICGSEAHFQEVSQAPHRAWHQGDRRLTGDLKRILRVAKGARGFPNEVGNFEC